MNKNIDIKVRGKFHFKNANLTIDNGITDWGMTRLAGHAEHPCWAVAENFYYLFLGASNAATSPTGAHKYTLIDPLFERSYNPVGNIDIFHNPDPTKTKTEYEVLPSGDMIVRFKQTFVVHFASAITVGEVGIGPAYYATVGRIAGIPSPIGFTGPGTWPACMDAVKGTVGVTNQRGDSFGNSIPIEDPTRLTHRDNAYYSLFSRATVPGPRARYSAGAREEVTYECEFTICNTAVGFTTGVSLNLAAVVGALPEDQFPANKTFIAQCPFFRLEGGKRTPQATVGGVARDLMFSGGGSPGGTLGEWGAYGLNQLIPSVFESSAANTSTSAEKRGLWMLEFFDDTATTGAIGDYATAVPLMSTDPWNIVDTASDPIPLPVTAQLLTVPTVYSNPRSAVEMSTPFKYLRTSTPPAGLWQTKVTFAFATDDLIQPIKYMNMWRGLHDNMQVKEDWRGFAGIFTMFETTWNPPPGRVVELSYTLTWQR
jgi:hypothetical protein